MKKVVCRYLPDPGFSAYDDSILVMDLNAGTGRLSEDGSSWDFRIQPTDDASTVHLVWQNESPLTPADTLRGIDCIEPGEFLTRTSGESGESWDYVVESVSGENA